MKQKHSLAIAVATVLGFALPVIAADKPNDKNASWQKTTRNIGDKTFGQIERASKLVGKDVRSSDNQKIGKIDDLVVDLESGHVLYAVVGSGGVLGAGEKKHAVAPAIFTQSGDQVRVTLDKEKIMSAPEFTKDIDKENELAKADFVERVHQHFGQNAWWKGSKPAGEGSFNNVHKVTDLKGMNVENASNEPMGEVEDLAIDLAAGRVVFAVLQPARSLELGNNLYALPPDALTRASDGKKLATGLTKEKLAAAPHIEKNNWSKLSDRSFASQVYQYYGKQAYFESGIQPTSERESQRVYPEKK